MSKYRASKIDEENQKWFSNNKDCNTLQKIAIEKSSIRGLGEGFEMEFKYPITVIVGENGSGKSTVLSLVSCAFHNNNESFCPMSLLANTKKQRLHYTYGDFFAFTDTERGIMSDIKITSTILSDKRNSDTRSKTPKGKWKDYDTRPKRAVSFLGINRILPPSESQTYRNYCGRFTASSLSNEENEKLTGYMNRIFGRDYTKISQACLNKKYRLYACTRETSEYTGFNMGAGENAVLQLLYEILNAGKGALIVVDEIELGLHVQAQRKLMEILKELCKNYNTQIICSSHSAAILESVPQEGRVMLKTSSKKTDVVYGITVEYATSELSGTRTPEKFVFVEDSVAKSFIETVLPRNIRARIEVNVIGSADNSIPYAIQTYFRQKKTNFLVVLDGDKISKKKTFIKNVKSALKDCKTFSSEDIDKHLNNAITYLPGNEWPEKVIVKGLIDSSDLTKIMEACKVDNMTEMKDYLRTALTAGKHKEFYSLGNSLHLEESIVLNAAIHQYEANYPEKVNNVITFISSNLSR